VADAWHGNDVRFASAAEAHAYAEHLYESWTVVEATRVVPSRDPVWSRWENCRAWTVH
jgi:hypothetical protein